MRTFLAALLLAFCAISASEPAAAQSSTGRGAAIGGGTGAIIGGIAGGGSGALIGGLIGGATGATIGRSAERRHGHYWYRGRCYRRVSGGFRNVSPRYCRR